MYEDAVADDHRVKVGHLKEQRRKKVEKRKQERERQRETRNKPGPDCCEQQRKRRMKQKERKRLIESVESDAWVALLLSRPRS